MSDILHNTRSFIEQQVELYGDEFALSRQEPPAAAAPSPDDGWRRSADLDMLFQNIRNCTRCALGLTRNKFVFGVGNPKTGIVLIGEAPGADEDRLGEPFVGRAGELLDKMLAAISLDRQSVYICNVLKCRPPQNRDPLPAESATCKPYLLKQLELLAPKLILCLGRIAAQTLLETTDSLTLLRNKWRTFAGAELLVTFHPAALLRDPVRKRDAWEDLKMFRQRITELHLLG